MDMQPAFAIGNEIPPDRPPATAEEYLQQVRWQANRIEDVIVAEGGDESEEASKPVFGVQGFSDAPIIPEGMKPTKEWQNDFISEFVELREKWEQNKQNIITNKQGPPPHDRKQWRQYCFGKKENAPLPAVILSLDFVSLQKVLTYHIRWAQSEPMTAHRARWLFVLLIRVELPLSPDFGSELYSLAMRCATLRSKLIDIKDPMLPHLNILITILEKFFGQILDVNDVESSEETEQEL